MSFPKDCIAFLYVHRDNGEVVFTSKGASHFCPIPRGSFVFDDLMAPGMNSRAHKEQTRARSSSINKFVLPLVDAHNGSSWSAHVYEMFTQGSFHGVVFTRDDEGVEYLATILLNKGADARSSLLLAPATTPRQTSAEATTSKLLKVFEQHLIHFPKHDQWFTSGGKQRFAEQVKYHVVRSIPLHLVLPAFPAKSCNRGKVLGKQPDKGEELAIHSMKIVADRVKLIYPPGVHFNIVSDGHVFSDSVGIDDADVDTYGHMFRTMAATLYPGLLTFYGLDDFLFDKMEDKTSKKIQRTTLEHPVKTVLTDRAEMARKILTLLFGSDESCLQYDIKNDKETAALYCGFKRFMLEDLAGHESYKNLATNVARRKLCSRVAFLMIQRNRAYSTMVEWLFPIQIRISIHPHPNKGPKYGINLIHPSLVAMQRDSNEKLFHTPTPWHNAVLEMPNGKFLLLPCATILNGFVIDGEAVVKVEPSYYPDGRPSHFKAVP